jgi:hypothetical protein
MTSKITSIAVSVDVSNKNYGVGDNSFCSHSAKWDEGEDPTLDDVLDRGIDLYFNAWESVMASRCVTGSLTPNDFKLAVGAAILRLDRVKATLKKMKEMPQEELGELVTSLREKKKKTQETT